MIPDDLLFMVIIAGIGLCGAYLRAELLLHRRVTAVQRRRELVQLELHSKKVRLEHLELSRPRTVPASFPANTFQAMKVLARGYLKNQSKLPMAMGFKLPMRPIGLLVAFFAMAALTGCPSGGNLLGDGCLVCGAPTEVNLEGSLTGLVGSRLTFQNSSGPGGFQIIGGAGSNGTNVLFAAAPFNSAYNLTVQTQPTNPSQTCVVTNGSGTAGTSNVTNIAVTCTTNPPRFAYVANRATNNVSAYGVDATTGALAVIVGSPFGVGRLPVAIAVDQTGHFAYVVNQMDATISAFTIDRSSGAMASISGSPFATGPSPTSVAIDPSSTFIYVTNGGGNTVSAYAIAAGSGALTAVSGSPIATGALPDYVTVEPSGNDVLVANESDGTVSVFSIDNGALAANGAPFAVGNSPRALSINPSGLEYSYVANANSNTLSVFSASTAITGSPYSTGTTPTSVIVDPLDHFVYVANQGSSDVSAFALDATTGALTVIAGSPFAAGTQPSSVVVDPTGMFAYVVNSGSDSVWVYAIDAKSGALSPIGGSPFVTGTSPSAIAISD